MPRRTHPEFEAYKVAVSEDIGQCLREMQVQPILFVGSGLSIRHFGAPTWDGLLSEMVRLCPRLKRDYSEYLHNYGHQIDCAEHFAEEFARWAKTTGSRRFPQDIVEAAEENIEPNAQHVYLKYQMSRFLDSITPSAVDDSRVRLNGELSALRAIQPHTIITTNYDRLLGPIFPDYTTVIGDQMLRGRGLAIGEVFKIHGDTSAPGSLVVTRRDYDRFKRRRKYLIAKLLTFFVEHPLLFVGYGANDPNIREILHDVGELEDRRGALVPNVFIVDWRQRLEHNDELSRELLVEVDTHRHVRVKRVITEDLTWVYDAFASRSPVGAFRVKPLRALLARVTKLVRKDVPAQVVEVDFGTLEGVINEEGQLDHILGVTQVGDGRDFNLSYRHTLSDVGIALGFNGWHGAKKLLGQILEEKGIDIHASDNRYHQAVKVGRSPKSITHKYSDEFISLLKKVLRGDDYEVAEDD